MSKLLLFFILFLSIKSFSQQSRKELIYEIFSEENGLPNSTIHGIVQDKFGFLWFGTDNGLSRYDGTTFENFFHTDDSLSIQSNEISELFVTKDGRLWIGFAYGGVSVFNPITKTFKNYLPENGKHGLPSSSVDMIFEDSKGVIWIGMTSSGLYMLERDHFRHIIDISDIDEGYENFTRNYYNTFYNMIEFRGLLWVASHNGLYTYDSKRNELTPQDYEVKKPGRIRRDAFLQVLHDNHETLWLTSWSGGLSSYNTSTHEWQNFRYNVDSTSSSANLIWSAQWKSPNELWLATNDKGLCVFNTTSNKFTFFSDPSLVEMKTTLFVDRNSEVWSGGDNFLLKLDSYKNQFIYHPTRFKSPRYFQVDVASKELFISPDVDSGLYTVGRINERAKFVSPADLRTGVITKDLLQTRDGAIWLLTYRTLFKHKKGKTIAVPALTSSTNMYTALLEDQQGILWILRFDNNSIIKYDIQKDDLKHYKDLPLGNFPHSMVQNKNGDIWIASFNGITQYSRDTDAFYHFSNNEQRRQLPDRRTTGVACDNQGRIWFSTIEEGIFEAQRVNDSLVYKSVKQSDGLPSDQITSLASDENDCLWLTSRSCITKFNTKTRAIHNFYLPREEDSQFKISKLQSNGRFYIGANNGYYSFDPTEIRIEEKPARVYIKNLKFATRTDFALSDSVYIDNVQRVGEDDNIEIEFGALTTIDSKRLKFAYRLNEVDEEWIFANNKNFASYPSLPINDSITFQLKVCNEFGVWSEPIIIRIFIKPTLLERTDARVAMGFGSLSFIAFLFWYQSKRIKMKTLQKSLVNNRITESKLIALRSQINPHFIFNALNAVQNTILIQQYDNAIRYLSDFSLLLRKILDNSFYSFVSLRDEIQTMELYLKTESIRFDNKFDWQIVVEEGIITEKVEMPSMLLQPFLENSVQHGLLPKVDDSEKSLRLSFFKQGDRFICEIKDNGIGRSTQKGMKLPQTVSHESRGIKLIEDRISLLNERYKLGCQLHIEDLSDEAGRPTGTKVHISFNFNLLYEKS